MQFRPCTAAHDRSVFHSYHSLVSLAPKCRAFLDANPDKIVVLKFYAPWCRACKSLAPKFLMRKNDEEYAGLPILWAQMSVQHNKEFIKALGVLALPSVLFYAGAEGLVENFPCGPSKIPIFKKKFKDLISSKINPATGKLNDFDCSLPEFSEAEPCTSRDVVDIGPSKTMKLSNGSVVITEDLWNHCRWQIPFFKDFNDDEFANLMKSAKLETFEDGQVVMKQGKKGEKFYIIESGKVEILVRGAFEDPLTTPSTWCRRRKAAHRRGTWCCDTPSKRKPTSLCSDPSGSSLTVTPLG